jgi:hypothetical protein
LKSFRAIPEAVVPWACLAFIEVVRSAWGVALVCRSLDDLIEGLEAAGMRLGELIGRAKCQS